MREERKGKREKQKRRKVWTEKGKGKEGSQAAPHRVLFTFLMFANVFRGQWIDGTKVFPFTSNAFSSFFCFLLNRAWFDNKPMNGWTNGRPHLKIIVIFFFLLQWSERKVGQRFVCPTSKSLCCSTLKNCRKRFRPQESLWSDCLHLAFTLSVTSGK